MSEDYEQSQKYLRSKLRQFLISLRHYQTKLLQKKEQTPSLTPHINQLVAKARLEQSHLEDQLNQMNRTSDNELPESRIRYKTRIFINKYDQLAHQIDTLLFKKQQRPSTASRSRKDNNHQKLQRKNSVNQSHNRSKQLRRFAQELNDQWVLDLLQNQKAKQKNSHKNMLQKYKQPPFVKPEPNIPSWSNKTQQINRRNRGIKFLQKQIICLEGTIGRIQQNLEQHRHRNIEEDIQTLKQEEAALIKGLRQIREGNQILQQEYGSLQRQLESLQRVNRMRNQQHFLIN